ncbi:MAG: DUF4199 domain-containing protein [Opitutae bacterium]|nr:DUF4199 domain-containing protein [Opitutae bacterium]
MKPELKYGLITGAGVCLWIMGEFLLGFHTTHLEIGAYSGYFSCVIPLTTLFLLLKGRRDAAPDRRLGLWPGIKSGLHAAFISGVIVYGFMFAYDNFINPGWLDHALDWRVARLRAGGVAETAIREEIKLYRQLNGPVGCLVSIVAGTTAMGGMFSAGITLLLRRWPRR